MSQPLTDAINALTTYVNEITGKSDTTLSDAVESLVDGYGGGGGGGAVTGTYTLSSSSKSIDISYSLDAVPTVAVLVYRGVTETLPDATYAVAAVGVHVSGATDIYVSSSAKKSIGVFDTLVTQDTTGKLTRSNITSASYGVTEMTSSSVTFKTGSNQSYWRQGTYDYYIF